MLEEARQMAAKLAAMPNRALQLCKQAIDLSFDTTEDEAIRRILEMRDEAFASADCKEGVRAFFAKERPHFNHS